MLAFLLLSPLLLTGCTTSNNAILDDSVDMSVREINMTNTSQLEMLDKARSAVVGISVDLYNGYAIGSGFAIKNGGYIVTNNHVIEDGNNITLYFADKSTGSAKVLWADAGLDLAILKSSREIPFLPAGTSKTLQIGEDVFALGTPLTLQFKHTVTKGIVSALGRTLEVDSDQGSKFLQSLVQHDASINPGNSGGPLITSEGKVVGINTLKASEGEGLGFASPIEVAEAILDRIIENNDYEPPYLGVFGFDSDIAQVYGEAIGNDGVYVISTQGPAKAGGLVKGDIITKIDDETIQSMQDLRKAMFKYDSGNFIKIEYIRNNQTKETEVQLTSK